MYETVYKALEEAGLEKKYVPQDYLNFFCLGNREVPYGSDSSGESPATNTPHVSLSSMKNIFLVLNFTYNHLNGKNHFLGLKREKKWPSIYMWF